MEIGKPPTPERREKPPIHLAILLRKGGAVILSYPEGSSLLGRAGQILREYAQYDNQRDAIRQAFVAERLRRGTCGTRARSRFRIACLSRC